MVWCARGAAERPQKDELAVASDSSVGSDAMRTLEDPVGDVFAAVWPKELEADAMQPKSHRSPCDHWREMHGRQRKCHGREMTGQ